MSNLNLFLCHILPLEFLQIWNGCNDLIFLNVALTFRIASSYDTSYILCHYKKYCKKFKDIYFNHIVGKPNMLRGMLRSIS